MSSDPGRAVQDPGPITVVILAGGSGTRMRSKTMKVLHALGGRTMVGHALAAAAQLRPRRVVAVVGHGREQVGAHILDTEPDALLAVQETQEGTGHAVRVAVEAMREAAAEVDGTVVVINGDTPLLAGATLADLVAAHTEAGAAVTLLSGEVADPFGYGRVVRDADGRVARVVEEKDATPEEAAIAEINSGVYAFEAGFLAGALGRITNDNAKGEYYLTDAVGLARADGLSVVAHVTDDVVQTEGANDRAQLSALGVELNRRTLLRWMREGVTVVDPGSTWVDVTVDLAPDVTLLPGVQLLGATSVAEDAVIGPDTTLKDVEVGSGASVVRTHAELATIGPRATVGPFSYLRPGARVGEGAKVGAFVEVKNSTLGRGAKVPHLSYVGDAEIGEDTNIGAGTIFANYDGVAKHRTVVGRAARTGSNNTFIAPVVVGDGAVTGGGTVVRDDVPPGSLAVSAGPQRTIEGWVAARRPGSAADHAAQAALGAGSPPAGDVADRADDPAPGRGTVGHASE